MEPTLLVKLCEEAVSNPLFEPKEGVTHCNQAADYVAHGLGCDDLRNSEGQALTANEMYYFMKSDMNKERWRPVTIGGTWVLSGKGALVFAAMNDVELGEPGGHGHISTVIPGNPVWSGHWNQLSPLCMNVGRENFIGRPTSFAFRECPEFFVWIPSIPKEVSSGRV